MAPHETDADDHRQHDDGDAEQNAGAQLHRVSCVIGIGACAELQSPCNLRGYRAFFISLCMSTCRPQPASGPAEGSSAPSWQECDARSLRCGVVAPETEASTRR